MTTAVRSLLLALVLISTFIVGSSAGAAGKDVVFPRLLSYSQLMRLKPSQRQAYIVQVRKMIVEIAAISKKNKKGLVAENTAQLESEFAVLEALLPSAVAQDAKSPSAAKDSVPTLGYGTFKRPFWECKGSSLTFDQTIATCRSTSLSSKDGSCDEGFVKVQRQNAKDKTKLTYMCVPEGSFKILLEERKQALTSPEGAPDLSKTVFANGKDSDEAKTLILGTVQAAETGTPTEQPAADATGTTATAAPPVADSTGTTVAADAQPAPQNQPDPAPQTEAPAPATPSRCAAENFRCESDPDPKKDAELKKAIKDAYFADSTADTCFFAGMINQFNGAKRPNNCKPESKFLVSQTQKEKEFRCRGKGEVICNPLIFCERKSGGPFCVPGQSNATSRCQNDFKEEDRREGCLDPEMTGLGDAWDAFAAKFDKICFKNKNSRAYFCSECGVIAARIVAMNKVAGTPCNDGAPTSGTGSPAVPGAPVDKASGG